MSSRRNVVRVCYTVDDIFKVPPHIELDDYNQVDWWGVKWNVLRIMLKDGTTLDIESEWDNPSNFDWKRPDEESTIVEEDDGQYGLDWSDEEKQEEPVATVVRLIEEQEKLIEEQEKLIEERNKLIEEQAENDKEAKIIYDNPEEFEFDPCEECGLRPSTCESSAGYVCEECFELYPDKVYDELVVALPPIDEYMKSIVAVVDEKLKKPLSIEVRWLLEKIKELPLKQYSQMKLIRDLLFTIEAGYYDEEFEVPAEMREKIYGVGLLLHMEGGFQLQQRCFYLAVNFMDDEKKRMKAIEYCWSGAGDWIY